MNVKNLWRKRSRKVSRKVVKPENGANRGGAGTSQNSLQELTPAEIIHRRYLAAIDRVFRGNGIYGAREISAIRGPRHASITIRLQDSGKLVSAMSDKLAQEISYEADTKEPVMIHRAGGVLVYQMPLPENLKMTFTRSQLRQHGDSLSIGVSETMRIVRLMMDSDSSPHTLVAGDTGSGKSVTVRGMMLALMDTYTPDQLQIAIVDPSSDFHRFDNEQHLFCPRATDAEGIAAVWESVYREYVRREQSGARFDQDNGTDLPPRIAVVADEIFKPQCYGDAAEGRNGLNDRNLTIGKTIANDGRKWGIHLILSTQEFDKNNLPFQARLSNRYVGYMPNAQASNQATGRSGSGLNCNQLGKKGDFFAITVEGVHRAQMAMVEDADYQRLIYTSERDIAAFVRQNQPRGDVLVPAPAVSVAPPVPVKTGRPRNALDNPAIIARFLRYGARVTAADTARVFGLTQHHHGQYKTFVNSIIRELKILQQAEKAARG